MKPGWRWAVSGLALVLALLALAASGQPPLQALGEIVRGSVGTPAAWRETLRGMTPLLIAGVAVYLALRAGLFNIGVEGQLLVGACASAAVALALPAGALAIAGAAIAGVVAGGLWALPAGLIKAYRGGHEVISTILLNYIGAFLTQALVNGPLKGEGRATPSTAELAVASQAPHLVDAMPFRMNSTLGMGAILAVALAVWMRRTVAGYELQAVGANPSAAECAGIDVRRVRVWAMVASGAIAGLAGSSLVLGYEHRFYSGFSSGYGFDALGVAILAAGNPWAVLPSALGFAALSQGATSLLDVPRGIAGIMVGLLILGFAVHRYAKGGSHG